MSHTENSTFEDQADARPARIKSYMLKNDSALLGTMLKKKKGRSWKIKLENPAENSCQPYKTKNLQLQLKEINRNAPLLKLLIFNLFILKFRNFFAQKEEEEDYVVVLDLNSHRNIVTHIHSSSLTTIGLNS